MKIKKYEARTEKEAIEKVKMELGLEALILNIKKIQPKGIFAFFRKPQVEVTAAYEEKPFALKNNAAIAEQEAVKANAAENVVKDKKLIEQNEKIKKLEKKLNSAEELLEKAVSQISLAQQSNFSHDRKYENNLIQVFYDALVSQGVTVEIADKLLEDVNAIDENEEIDISLIVKVVYNTIVSILGEPATTPVKKAEKGNPRIFTFMGPTGVGKTTTIAKLSSIFILNESLNVGLITADTYRIAAVEQLKTYAEILGVEVGVAYNLEDLGVCIENMRQINDVIFVDTAGRSHKNDETLKELDGLLSVMPQSDRYLVLSTTTKYEDLLNIVTIYSSVSDFKIIFTKLDETTSLGSILNICYLTGKKISYVTNGQNVPDDIEAIQPEKIAKALLGFGGVMN